jgi:PAS domain S-box-containing protein
MNRKGIAILGYETIEEVLELDIAGDVYADPADRRKLLAQIDQEEGGAYEIVAKKKRGERIVLEISLTAERAPEGTVVSYRGIMRDVTEHKRREEALRDAERRLRQVFNSVPDTIFLLDFVEDGGFSVVECNTAQDTSPDVYTERLSGGLIVGTLPIGIARLIEDKLAECVSTGHTVEFDDEVEMADGRRALHATLIPIRNEAGKIERIVGMSRDITEPEKA